MEYYFYPIIAIIIIMKILFWTCYFYIRAQRIQQARTQHRFLIIGAPPARASNNPHNDRSAIINHAEPISATRPPPYAEVAKGGSCPLPPPYNQASALPQTNGMPPAPGNSAAAFQGSQYNGAGAMPACRPANGDPGNSYAAGYNPAAASQMNSYPPAPQSQPSGGQMPGMAAHPHTTVSMPGKNPSAPSE